MSILGRGNDWVYYEDTGSGLLSVLCERVKAGIGAKRNLLSLWCTSVRTPHTLLTALNVSAIRGH